MRPKLRLFSLVIITYLETAPTLTRIFLTLAIISVLLLLLNVVLGFNTGDVGGMWRDYVKSVREFREFQNRPDVSQEEKTAAQRERQQQYDKLKSAMSFLRLHLLVGVLAALTTVLVNSICVTYFIGTTRWCREVTEAYDLDKSMLAESNALKRKSFPWAVASIVLILAIVALGSLSDPNVSGANATNWRTPHYLLALVSTAVIAWGFFTQWNNIAANYVVINRILDAVRRVREEKGLGEPTTNSDRKPNTEN